MENNKGNNRELVPGGPFGFLCRRWMVILVPLLLLPVISYFNALGKDPVFRSTARLLVEESNLSSPLLDSFSLKLDFDAQLRTLEKTAMQPIILNKVHSALAQTDSSFPTGSIDDLATLLEIHVAKDGGVTLKAFGPTPERARNLTESFKQVCTAELNRPRVEAAQNIMDFLMSEFQQARTNLDKSHQQLSSYRATHGKVLPELEAITYNLLLSLEAEQVQLDAQRHALAEKRQQLEGDPAVRGQTVPGLKEQVSRLENDIQAYSKKMTESHPELQIMRARLARLELDLSLRQQGLTPPNNNQTITKAEENYRLLLIEQKALAERIRRVDMRVNELQLKIASASNHDSEYVRRLRDVESHTEIYLDLVRRRERAATSLHLVQKNHGDLVRVLQESSLPTDPDSPRPVLDFLVGLISGFVVGMALASGAEISDGRIFGSRNLEIALGAPTLLVMNEHR